MTNHDQNSSDSTRVVQDDSSTRAHHGEYYNEISRPVEVRVVSPQRQWIMIATVASIAVTTATYTATAVRNLVRRVSYRSDRENDMKLKNAVLHDLLVKDEFVPQAIIAGEVEDLSRRLELKLESNNDDFDDYVGAGFIFEGTPVAVMRYAGHPHDRYTIYLPYKVQGTERITNMIHDIVSALRLSPDKIVWERKHDPDL